MNRQTVSEIGVAAFVGCLLLGIALSALLKMPWLITAGALVGAYFLLAIKVARQWEKVAVLRLGKLPGLMGRAVL